MTLKQAFTMWACAPRNTVLAANSRAAVQKVLLKKYSDMDLEQFTPAMAERLFRESSEPQEVKTKAASILVYLLQWGGDHGHCKRPVFDYTIANQAEPETATNPKKKEHINNNKNDEKDSTGAADAPQEGLPDGTAAEAQGAAGADDERHDDPPADTEEGPVRKRRTPANSRMVCAIDPDTLEVVKTFRSGQDGCRYIGVKTIDKALRTLTKAGGYYWTRYTELKTFKERLSKKQASDKRKNPRPKTMTTQNSKKNTDPVIKEPVRALEEFSDQELRIELERRGWHGQLSRTETMDFGT